MICGQNDPEAAQPARIWTVCSAKEEKLCDLRSFALLLAPFCFPVTVFDFP
jgi:hypothetical protein